MSLGGSIRHSAKWVLGGNVMGQALQFAVGVVLARLLAPADFGMLVTIQIFTGLAGFVSGAGMGQALVQAKDVQERDFQVVFTIQLAIGLMIYTVFFLIAPWFATWFNNPLYADLLRVSALSFILRPFATLPNASMNRDMRFKERTVVGFFCGIVGGGVSIVMAWNGMQVWSLIAGGMAGTVLGIVLLTPMVRVRPALRIDKAIAMRLGSYGFKTTLNDLVCYVRSQAANFVLSRLGGPAVVGLYNKADSLAKTPSIISGSINDPVFRGLSKIQENKDQSRYLYFRTITLLTVYMLPVYVGLAWLAEPFIQVVYGPKWVEAAAPLSILCLGGLFVCIGHPSGAVLAAQNWLGREAVVQTINLFVVVIACLLGLKWGLTGVAWGMLIAHAYSTLHMNWLVNRCIGANFQDLLRSLVPGLILNALLVATLLVLEALLPQAVYAQHPAVYLLAMSAAGAMVYALAFLFLPLPALSSESIRWKRKLGLSASV